MKDENMLLKVLEYVYISQYLCTDIPILKFKPFEYYPNILGKDKEDRHKIFGDIITDFGISV